MFIHETMDVGGKKTARKAGIQSKAQMDSLDLDDSIFFIVRDPSNGTTCKTVNPIDDETVGTKSILIKLKRYGMTSKCVVASNYLFPTFRKDFIFISP